MKELGTAADFRTALVIGRLMTAGIAGQAPVECTHIHACGCTCNSTYCEDPKDIPCQNHGGPPRIQKGYEPWRGR